MRVRYISSPRMDDSLGPEEFRRYTNNIISFFLFFSAAFLALLIPVFFDGYFFNGTNPFLQNLLALVSSNPDAQTTVPPSILLPKLFLSVTPPLFLSYFLTNYLTKPINRQVHIAGNFLDDSQNVLENLRKDFYRPSSKPDLALIRQGDIDFNISLIGKEVKETIYLPPEALELSTVVRGEAGSGKTVVGDRYTKEVIDNGHKLILHSIKGDEITKLSGYTPFYLIEPWNKHRGYAIDYLNMTVSEDKEKEQASIRTFVDSFNTILKGKETFFDKGATAVIEAIVRSVVSETKINGIVKGDLGNIVQIWNDFDVKEVDTKIDVSDPDSIRNELKKNNEQLTRIKAFLQVWNKSATIYVDPDNAKTSLCVLASCIEVIRKFDVLSKFWKGRKTLDIKKWIATEPTKDRQVIILVNSNKFADVANCYISAFLNLTVSEVIEESYNVDWKLWFLLDEFPQLSSIKIDEFLKLPDVGRGKGIRVMALLQRTSQIKSAFGIDGESFIGAFQNKIWARMATDDLSIIEREIGKKDVREYTVSSNNSAQGKSTSSKINRTRIDVINANHLQNELGPISHNGNFCGVKVLFKFTNNPRIALVTMPPVKFEPKFKNKLVRTSNSGAQLSQAGHAQDGESKEEIIITTETIQELETTINGDTEYELEPEESDPLGSALSHIAGGEVVSVAMELSEVIESLEGFSKNNNTTEIIDSVKIDKSKSVKNTLEMIRKAKNELNNKQEIEI